MNFGERMERLRAKDKGLELCFLSKENAHIFSLEWRTGKRRMLSWSQFKEARLEDGDLVISFASRKVAVHGLNLGELADAIEEGRLAKIWEQRADYRPSPDHVRAVITRIEIRDSDSDECDMSPGKMGDHGRDSHSRACHAARLRSGV